METCCKQSKDKLAGLFVQDVVGMQNEFLVNWRKSKLKKCTAEFRKGAVYGLDEAIRLFQSNEER